MSSGQNCTVSTWVCMHLICLSFFYFLLVVVCQEGTEVYFTASNPHWAQCATHRTCPFTVCCMEVKEVKGKKILSHIFFSFFFFPLQILIHKSHQNYSYGVFTDCVMTLTLAHILYLTLSVLVTSIVESLMQTLTWGGKLKAFSCLWTSFSDLTGSLNLTPLRSLLHQKKVSCGGSFCILKWTKIIILWV